MKTTIDDVRERLTEIRPVGLRQDILTAGMVRDVRVQEGRVIVQLLRGPLPAPILDATVVDIRQAVGAMEGVSAVDVQVGSPQASGDMGPLPGVGDIIAVSSTKGGVGKSTVAVNLACGLVRLNQRVGLLDADVYGPSVPTMLGLADRPHVTKESKIFPLEKYGLRAMSIGFFLDDSSPVIWRGPLVTGLLRQFLKDVQWGELDVLVIDLPPGTGDAQLTVVQQVPLTGGVVVTTPQEVSLLDVERGVAMFHQVNTPVLGIVENMSHYVCPQCGEEEEIFGNGGGARLARECGVPLLGQIPLLPEVRVSGDEGKPLIVDQPSHPVSAVYLTIAQRLLKGMAAQREHAPGPRIVG